MSVGVESRINGCQYLKNVRVCPEEKPTQKMIGNTLDLGSFIGQRKRRLRHFHCIRNFYWKKDLPKEAEECALQVRGQSGKNYNFAAYADLFEPAGKGRIITLYPKNRASARWWKPLSCRYARKHSSAGSGSKSVQGGKTVSWKNVSWKNVSWKTVSWKIVRRFSTRRGDRHQEALYNLLDNAVKYTDPGDWIEVCWTEYELFLRIDVTDHGIGIPEQETGRIFGRFVRGEQVRNQEGVGIGLYLADQIVTGEGGYLKVKSIPGERTTFSMFFQIKSVETDRF